MTIISGVSGEWPRDSFDAPPAETTNKTSLNDSDSCEPVAPDSPEGQLILVEAVRSLERRLSPGARALFSAGQDAATPGSSNLKRLCSGLRSFFQPNDPHSLNKNPAVKQSVEDYSAEVNVADGSLQPSRRKNE